MNVFLTPRLQKLVRDKVTDGTYSSAGDVVRAALQLLQHQERNHQVKQADLRKDIAKGIKDLDEGRSTKFDKAAVERIKSKVRSRLARRNNAKPQ